MIRQTFLPLFVLAASAAALASTPPGAFSEGSTVSRDNWKLSYRAIAQPPVAMGQHIKIQTDATHTDADGGPTVFHRFFTDPVNRTYFGYDLAVEPLGKTNSAIVKFQPLSLRGDQLPGKYASSEFRAAPAPRFPTQTFKSGQTIAVDVLENPGSGQKVVDYVLVAFVPNADNKPGAQTGVAADVERAKTVGSPSAPVRIEIYSDFQCPACKAFHETVLPLLLRDFVSQGKVCLVSREFPLPMHPHSREAADLATSAAQVGKYQAVADALFLNQNSWGSSGKVWDTVAGVLTTAEQKKVQELLKAPSTLELVQQDVDSAMMQKVNQTPTLIISRGQKRYPFAGPGLDNYPILKSLIEELLK